VRIAGRKQRERAHLSAEWSVLPRGAILEKRAEELMRKAAIAAACLVSLTFLGGCDVLNFIWQGIVGVSYNGITLASIQGKASSMTSSTIPPGRVPGNSVLAYKTRGGFFGKMGVLSSGTNLTIQFTTYDAAGAVMAQSASLTVNTGNYCDLESAANNPVVGLNPADFQWTTAGLLPQVTATTSALFYVYP
jgi:hypothetical protein